MQGVGTRRGLKQNTIHTPSPRFRRGLAAGVLSSPCYRAFSTRPANSVIRSERTASLGEMAHFMSAATKTAMELLPPAPPIAPPPSDLLVSATTAVQVGLAAGSLLVLVPVASVIAFAFLKHRHRQWNDRDHNIPWTPAAMRQIAPPPPVAPMNDVWSNQNRPLAPQERAGLEALEADRVCALRRLPAFSWAGGSNTGDVCVLCIEQYDNGAILRKLPCDHYFHKEVRIVPPRIVKPRPH